MSSTPLREQRVSAEHMAASYDARTTVHDHDSSLESDDYPEEEEDLQDDHLLRALAATEGSTPNETMSNRISRTSYRALALLCACMLSVGTHYASYTLGPLKSRLGRELGTSNTEFSLLMSAFSLNSTWTPLIGGLAASHLGTTLTSLLATGAIFLGQLLILAGDLSGNVRMMVAGSLLFGLGVSPVSVIQETIIIRFFKGHNLGISLALGLIAGKGASFIAARTSYPLAERFGAHAPFYCATILTALSFTVNLIYVGISKRLVRGARAHLEAPDFLDQAVAKKKKVYLREIPVLGDIFWLYMLLNVLCGTIWHPFLSLAPNLVERRFGLSEADASTMASYLLAGSFFLYPIVGHLVDQFKNRPIVHQLLLLSSLLTMAAYAWLALPPSFTNTPIPAIVSFGIGNGFSPLLLVVIVPRIVPQKYISTALGAHKSLEQAGSVLSQTLAGVLLDSGPTKKAALLVPSGENADPVQRLFNRFLFLNVLQFCSILALWWLDSRWKSRASSSTRNGDLPSSDHDREDIRPTSPQSPESAPLLQSMQGSREPRPQSRGSLKTSGTSTSLKTTTQERLRGGIFSIAAILLVLLAWILFMGIAWAKLRSRKEREG